MITHGGRLPAETSRFFGRSHEAAAVKAALARSRLVTVTGPGGIGKTRLAVKVAGEQARAFPDGVFLADLSAARDAAAVARAVTAALGTDDEEGHHGRRLLLILDTCERVVDACAQLAEAILRGGDGPVLLVTGRQPLDLPGEVVFRLPPLAAGDAVSLFADRAAAAQPGFAVTGDALPKVTRLCRMLDDTPLALELAALRLRAVGLDELLARLPGHLRLLGCGRTAGGERQRSLLASINWSYDLCTPAERLLWTRLSVLADGFDLEAAEAAGAATGAAAGASAGDGGALPADQVLDTLIGLVDKSIVLRLAEAEAEAEAQAQANASAQARADGVGAARYRLPAIVREHGAALRAGGSAADQEDADYEGRWRLLTPREREVAGLVAKGLTNREIAACLVVSKRTVDAHLEHILGKLGYASRVQVAALAQHEQAFRADARSVPAQRAAAGPRTGAAGPHTGAGRLR